MQATDWYGASGDGTISLSLFIVCDLYTVLISGAVCQKVNLDCSSQ